MLNEACKEDRKTQVPIEEKKIKSEIEILSVAIQTLEGRLSNVLREPILKNQPDENLKNPVILAPLANSLYEKAEQLSKCRLRIEKIIDLLEN